MKRKTTKKSETRQIKVNDLDALKTEDSNDSEIPEQIPEPCNLCPPVECEEAPKVEDVEISEDKALDISVLLAEMTENWQRERAHFQNYKRRTEDEKGEIRKYAGFALAGDIIRIVDYFESSVTFEENLPEESRNVIIGVKYTLDELIRVLAAHGVYPIKADEGQPFDSTCMEAVERRVVEDAAAGTILKIQLRGWSMHDRILRASRVIVAVEPEEEAEEEKTKGGEPAYE